jgi:hypothetical protein
MGEISVQKVWLEIPEDIFLDLLGLAFAPIILRKPQINVIE